MSRDTIASGAAENTPENLRLWIQNPDAIKPGSLMPAMKLSDAELDARRRVPGDAPLAGDSEDQPCQRMRSPLKPRRPRAGHGSRRFTSG